MFTQYIIVEILNIFHEHPLATDKVLFKEFKYFHIIQIFTLKRQVENFTRCPYNLISLKGYATKYIILHTKRARFYFQPLVRTKLFRLNVSTFSKFHSH